MNSEQVAINGVKLMMEMMHKTAKDAGWYHDSTTGDPIQRNVGEVIALMHSELSEALEAYRRDLMDDKLPHRKGIEVEFADCVIRIMDTCVAMELDLAGALVEKNQFNKERADHKLANRKKPGGKKF